MRRALVALCVATGSLGACAENDATRDGSDAPSSDALVVETRRAIEMASGGTGLGAFVLPASDELDAIPQDPSNPLTAEKVALGQLLFHDTAFALEGRGAEPQSWSCATCHHAAAGFKSGVPQGIAEGGVGFGERGERRTLDPGFDADAPDDAPNRPDLQPVASPTVLNSAYQDVVLWNGQFGNAPGGPNAGVDAERLLTPGTPKVVNAERLSGLETQALAGLGVHRLRVEPDTVLQTNPEYRRLWKAAYPEGSDDVTRDAAKAIAAFERTVLAARAPFQRFLRGDAAALDGAELRGARLFFGEAACVSCHTGPALSSAPGASAEAMFFAIGMADFDTTDARIHGTVDEATSRGRGGLTGAPSDDFRFKVPTLYNLADTDVFGHGASFASIREVVEYKNRARPQRAELAARLDSRFAPLGLTPGEIDDLTAFLTNALRDPELDRYAPASVPSGLCVTVNAFERIEEGSC